MPDTSTVSSGASEPVTPVYDELYYNSLGGPDYEYEGHWKDTFSSFADHILREFQPRTVLDAGCGKGFLVQALRERGVEAYGFDISTYAISAAPEQASPYLWVGSITDPLPQHYDLIVCIEVFEHLDTALIARGAEVLCEASDRVLFSSTFEGGNLSEPSHFNMKSPEDWAAIFASQSFLRDLHADVTWLTPWAMLFERRPALAIPDLVRAYERVMARQVREIHELRLSAVRLEARLQQLHRQLATLGNGERGQLEAEAAEARAEALRMQDLLRVSERQLGQALGENASLRDQLSGYDDLATRYHTVITSTTWRTAWKLLAPLRKVRARVGRSAS